MAHYLNPHHGPCGHLIRPGTSCRACSGLRSAVTPAGFLAAYGYPQPGTCEVLLTPEKPCGKPAVDDDRRLAPTHHFCEAHLAVLAKQSGRAQEES